MKENEKCGERIKEGGEPKSRERGPEGTMHIALDVKEIDLMNNSCGAH